MTAQERDQSAAYERKAFPERMARLRGMASDLATLRMVIGQQAHAALDDQAELNDLEDAATSVTEEAARVVAEARHAQGRKWKDGERLVKAVRKALGFTYP